MTGRAGTLTTLPALGALDGATALAAGGGAPIRVAHVALFRVEGRLARRSGDVDRRERDVASRRSRASTRRSRAARRCRAAGLRASEAYLDLQDVADGRRAGSTSSARTGRASRCRLDVSAERRLADTSASPARARTCRADASAWQPTAVAVAASATPFPDGEPRFVTLAPSTAIVDARAVVHGDRGRRMNQVFSFFAAPARRRRVGASAGAAGTAVFDLAAGQVVADARRRRPRRSRRGATASSAARTPSTPARAVDLRRAPPRRRGQRDVRRRGRGRRRGRRPAGRRGARPRGLAARAANRSRRSPDLRRRRRQPADGRARAARER